MWDENLYCFLIAISAIFLLLYARLRWERGFKGQCIPAGGIKKDFVVAFFLFWKKLFQLRFQSHLQFWGSNAAVMLRCFTGNILCTFSGQLNRAVKCLILRSIHPKYIFLSDVYLACPTACNYHSFYGATKLIWNCIKNLGEVHTIYSVHTRNLTRYSTGDKVRIIFLCLAIRKIYPFASSCVLFRIRDNSQIFL